MLELRLDRVSKQYQQKIAVDRVSFTFGKGVYGLLGANGAGKTTLLRMIAGLLVPESGEILFQGQDIKKLGGEYRRGLGYLPQESGYYPEFTGIKYLRYLAQLKALSPETANRRIEMLLEQTGLAGEENRKLKTYSGGMLRRIGIAQALLNDPDILILDEPTSGLDPRERIRFRNLISSLGRERIVILSSHIVSDIEYIADEILLMKEGAFVRTGEPAGILKLGEGKVWECLVDAEKAEELNRRYLVSNLKNEEGRVRVRIVSDSNPQEGAKEAAPGLEDVYLYCFGKQEEV